MVMRAAFTLIEMIFVVLIAGLLSLGTFKAFNALYTRSAQAKAMTDLSLQSQIVLDQLGVLLYNRIPGSAIGSYKGLASCHPIDELNGDETVLEWLAFDDAGLLQGAYDGFIDMNDSARPTMRALNMSAAFDAGSANLIFAGAFDAGSEEASVCGGAFGWHGNASTLSYGFTVAANQITFNPGDVPDTIYEKFYITKGAYAVTRGADVGNITPCGLNEADFQDFNNTLFLFYGFHPYAGETYCGDSGGGGTPAGNAVILAEHVSGFRATYVNEAIRLSLDMNQTKANAYSVHISKQKAVF